MAGSRVDVLLHPVTLGAMVVLGLNDHWLKDAYPGWITGKLSDFAGLVFFPAMLAAVGIPRRWAAGVTAVAFALVKTVAPINACWNELFSWIYQTLGYADAAALRLDPTDLIALPAVWVCLIIPGATHVPQNQSSRRPRAGSRAHHCDEPGLGQAQ